MPSFLGGGLVDLVYMEIPLVSIYVSANHGVLYWAPQSPLEEKKIESWGEEAYT